MSPRPSVSSMVVTSKPSIAACSALIGSISVTIDASAHAAQRMRRALAYIAIAADDCDLAGNHHVGRALDAVGQRFAAAVEVVELRLGDRVIDIDRRNQQLALLLHLVEPVNAGRGLFRDAAPFLDDFVPVLRVFGMDLLQQVLDHASSWLSEGVFTQPSPSSSS